MSAKANLVRGPLVAVGVDDSPSPSMICRRVAPPIGAVVLKRRPQALDDGLEAERLVAPGGEEGVELEASSTPVVVGILVNDYCSAERRAWMRGGPSREAYQSKPHAGLVRAVAADDDVHIKQCVAVADRLPGHRKIGAGQRQRRDREDGRPGGARSRRSSSYPRPGATEASA